MYLVLQEPSFGLYKTPVSWMCLAFDQEASITKKKKKKNLDGSNVKWVCHHDMLDSWCRICFITYIYDNDG